VFGDGQKWSLAAPEAKPLSTVPHPICQVHTDFICVKQVTEL
jgi:hypothetical protein